MTKLIFPDNPSIGQTVYENDATWLWDGVRWNRIADIGYRGSVGYSGSQGQTGYAGSAGLTGGIGYTGSRGVGFAGSSGRDGYSGSAGAVGAPTKHDEFQGDGTPDYTMSIAVLNDNHIIVSVNGLIQIPTTDYNVSGTTIHFNNIPPVGSDIEIRFFEVANQVGFSGSIGYTGSLGYRGSAGYRGSVGYKGSDGLAEVIITPGITPANAIAGELWWDSESGVLSIYYDDELTWVGVDNTLRGPQGFAGSIGDIGFTGSRGFVGSLGYAGPTGFNGSTGSQGTTGFTGSHGSIGYTGSVPLKERLSSPTGSGSSLTFDCTTSRLFEVNPTQNFQAVITNLDMGAPYATNIVLVIYQGATPYIPNSITVDGFGPLTIDWIGGSAPTGNANKKDVVSFTILQKNASNFTIFGQLITFG